MKKNAQLETYGSNIGDGLNRSRLIVRMHHGYHRRVFTNQAGEELGIYDSSAIDRKDCDIIALALTQMLDGMKDRVMLDGGNNEMLPAHSVGTGDAHDSEIARLRASTGKNNLMGLRTEDRCETITGIIDGRPRLTSRRVNRRRISKVTIQKWQHGIPRLRGEWRGGVVV
jgi:hypothetical protein